jgi:hypothetical protein
MEVMMKTQSVRSMMIGGLALTALAGCSTASSAPFHMYGSPLLEGDMRAQRTVQSHYDPFRLGDHEPSDTVIALEQRQTMPATPQAASPPRSTAERRDTPAPTRVGTSQGTRNESARPATPLSSTRTTPASSSESKPADAPGRPAESATADSAAAAAQFVKAVYALNAVELTGSAGESIPELYRTCRAGGKVYHSSRPAIGDLVFYHNTFDANADGRNNDWYTHVGLVENVDRSGTISVLSYRDGAVTRHHLNLEVTEQASLPGGKPANTALRKQQPGDAPFTQYLAGQLFAGFCGLLGDQSELVLVDNWQPGMNLSR